MLLDLATYPKFLFLAFLSSGVFFWAMIFLFSLGVADTILKRKTTNL